MLSLKFTGVGACNAPQVSLISHVNSKQFELGTIGTKNKSHRCLPENANSQSNFKQLIEFEGDVNTAGYTSTCDL